MIGRHLSELDTPALCIDLDVLDENIRSMSKEMRDAGKAWRPHVKCHKVPEIARQQLTSGAIGVTAAKSSEAEVFVENQVSDVLIANLIVGEQKLERIARMCREGDPIVACDHFVQAERLSDVCRRSGVICRVIVELDIGMNRVGVRPGPDAEQLVRGIDRLQGIRLVGIMGYEGHLLTESETDRKRKRIEVAISLLERQRDRMIRDGICCDIVSAGGTGSYQMTAHLPVVTEIQAGGGIFGDPFYSKMCGVTGLRPALGIVATVVSRPSLMQAVLDIGRKSIHTEISPPEISRMANGKELTDASINSFSAEHTVVELGPESRNLIIGDKVIVVPGYSDLTTLLYDQFYGLRDNFVERILPIVGRGKIQ
ncbi:D-threonine aldolase [Thalassoglobus neptunius]|uniref:D-threonine aldolase n=1 Tax=Thalassoglobus neptunius TaxID=1938619 RepID=A0A5C5WLK6_9PLAN|nr:alanine racemase [Thalassoglobus neptunius]TWT51507.1 D-threonine aldolase [Thalassoglobus neptunius]